MENHAVVVDMEGSVPEIQFADIFNATVAFVDRHLKEGRAAKTALMTDSGNVSYARLAENANRCGNALKDLGFRQGDTIVMAIRDCPMFFYVFWGAIKAGIVPIPVNTFLKAEDYAFLIDDSECKGFIYSTELTENAAPAAKAAGRQLSIAMATTGADSLEARMASASRDLDAASTTQDSECFWLYSSGSTGKPKGVVHVHRDMVITSALYGRNIAGIGETDIVYSASKLFFSFGFGGGMTFPLWAGAATVLCEETTNAALTFDIIERFRPDVFFGVPSLYAQQLHLAEIRQPDMSSVRIALSAGEALPAHVFRKMRDKLGITILDGIGSTEVLHIFISNRLDDIRPGTSGRVVPGYEVKIVGENGESVPDGEFGTLHVKGLSNAKLYWKNPEKTAGTMLGEWLNTGDIYKIDEDGYYVNAGRGDDMLKVGAMWCSPLEIEEHLIRHPAVREAAVVGQTDDDALVKPAAYIVVRDSSGPENDLSAELSRFCKAGLAGYKYPRWFYFVDDLPKTVTGKIQRFKLRSIRN